jgi:hypothetical protein
MPERRVPTLADAKRQARWRRITGYLLLGLALLFLLLSLAKFIYVDLSYSIFASTWGVKLRHFIDLLLNDWAVLALLWRAIPPWHPVHASPTNPFWSLWPVLVVSMIGGLLLRSASARYAQFAEFQQEMQREAWRQQARAAQGLPHDDRVTTTVIGQAILHQYRAPPESWSQTPRGIVILGLIVAMAGGVILLFLEYGYFQVR